MSSNQEIVLSEDKPTEFKLVIVPFYGTAAQQAQGVAIPVTQADNTAEDPILVPMLIAAEDGSEIPLISVSVIYQIGCVLNCIPGISIPADNRPIHLNFVKTGCVNFLTVSEPLNSLPECCDIHAAA